jgi:hypothetical protein
MTGPFERALWVRAPGRPVRQGDRLGGAGCPPPIAPSVLAQSTVDRCPAPARREAPLKHTLRRLRLLVVVGAAGLLVAVLATPALAQAADPTLSGVVNRIRDLIVGLAAGLATLFLTVGGIRYLMAGGDPGQVEKAKTTLRSAAIGYGVAALAPALSALLKFIVGV